MKSKFVLGGVSLLMVASLILVSCGQSGNVAETTTGDKIEVNDQGGSQTQQGQQQTEEKQTETGQQEVQQQQEATDPSKPQYGGTIIFSTNTNWQDFDEVVGSPITFNHPMRFTSQELWIGDWSKGPAGTNDTRNWSRALLNKTGDLAESWNFDEWDAGKLVFNIRKGVHFGLDQDSEASRLVGGREVTADDVIFTFKQISSSPTAYIYNATPVLRNAKMTAPDKYTLVIEADPPTSTWVLRIIDFIHIFPHEVVETYGDMSDWRNLVGSGPFMLKDLVDNSSVTFTRNPNYYMKNPVGPGEGDQLPYADEVRVLIIADANTRQTAFRTGRIDELGNQNFEDGPDLIDALPDIVYYENEAFGGAGNVAMRTDQTPFNDIRVRKAMFKALDFKAIAEALYGKGARWLAWPIGYSQDYKDAYLDVNDPDTPDEVKDVFTYDPEAAKQLLAEAGYPDGLKGDVIVLNRTDVLDWFQTMQTFWAQIGVDVTLDPREQGAWYTILQNRNYDFMMWGTGLPISLLHTAGCMYGTTATNPSFIDDPVVNEARTKMMALSMIDDPAADALHRELMKYVLAQAWVIPMPGGVSYDLWWPWLKNFYGDLSVGYLNTDNWVTWAWVDRDLKKSMGH